MTTLKKRLLDLIEKERVYRCAKNDLDSSKTIVEKICKDFDHTGPFVIANHVFYLKNNCIQFDKLETPPD